MENTRPATHRAASPPSFTGTTRLLQGQRTRTSVARGVARAHGVDLHKDKAVVLGAKHTILSTIRALREPFLYCKLLGGGPAFCAYKQ